MNKITRTNKEHPITMEYCYIDPTTLIIGLFDNSVLLNATVPKGWIVKRLYGDMPLNPNIDWNILLERAYLTEHLTKNRLF